MIKILKLILFIIIIIALMLFSVSLWAKSTIGRDTISQFIVKIIAKQTDYKLKIENFNLSFPLIISADKIAIRDNAGEFLSAEYLYINILPSPFPFYKIVITNI